MRISRTQVAENRERLLQIAVDRFREHGIDGVGVADLMKAAGMTLGSFYSYFESKEQLITEACARAIADTQDRMVKSLTMPGGNALARTAESYLSTKHRDNLAGGCVLAALGGEISHQPKAVRRAATKELEMLFGAVADTLPGNRKQRHAAAISTIATLVGGLILSRMADEPVLSQQILNAVKASVKQSTETH